MTTFAFQFLGQFQIRVGATPVTNFHSDKARALLAYLALEPTKHMRSALATLFRTDIGDQYARINLRNTLYRPRQTLDDVLPETSGRIQTVSRQAIQFNTDPLIVDVH